MKTFYEYFFFTVAICISFILPQAIATVLKFCLDFPQKLIPLAQNSQINQEFTLDTLA
ncbi:hypothetical protein H6G33_00975 [Calothrix sp. FACHB-1219]|uniref:hypothetical protein n=1 Tax=unclassified Calothrix TaxID=2619626 RepID=UPI001681D3C0|nr:MULTISPECIES: hypothetical protein [unclassified Calothrix]MBD2201174.1 hypothetical protein [Calothrix sp. FACHB-168]MBD2215608.1 hypothetical protein [Calothrix sp. FACHB-1219]